MAVFSLTNVGRSLRQHNLLDARLAQLGPRNLVNLDAAATNRLVQAGLLAEAAAATPSLPPSLTGFEPFRFITQIEALNIELTYRCNLTCDHCQQGDDKPQQEEQPLSEEEIIGVLDQAEFAGIIQRGVNFTGGEPLLYRPDIFRLLEHVRDLGHFSRLNTNGWWGLRHDFVVGEQTFSDSRDLVRQLKTSGLTILVVSLDGLASTHDRRRGQPGLFNRVIDIIDACQEENLLLRIIATGAKAEEKEPLAEIMKAHHVPVDEITQPAGSRVKTFFGLGFKHEIDIGQAGRRLADTPSTVLYDDNLLCSSSLPCQGKGFIRPQALHIAPNGDVRPCNMAQGLANLGSLLKDSLIEILNRYPSDRVSLTFAEQIYGKTYALEEAAERLFHRDLFKGFSHPCCALSVIARLLEAEEHFFQERQREPNEQEIRQFNLAVASALGLTRLA
ncbi:MAG: radical SAM protein [bacterium]